jgi:PadR family transcriptional regulator, regulatory protein PadR
MDANLLRGHLDLILLGALGGGAKYGSQIISEVEEQTAGYFQFKEGSLYPALHRLEKQGWVRGEFQVLPRGGSPVKFYVLTAAGQSELRRRREEFEQFTRAVGTVLGGV